VRSSVTRLLAIVVIVFGASACRDRMAEMFPVGTCVDFDAKVSGGIVVQDCAGPHTHVVYAIVPNELDCDERVDVQYDILPAGTSGAPRHLCLVAAD
jgi:hypothetical protein